MFELVRLSRIYVHSAGWEASVPYAVLEAALIGLPIVARSIPAFRDRPGALTGHCPSDCGRLVSALLSNQEDYARAAKLSGRLNASRWESASRSELVRAYSSTAQESNGADAVGASCRTYVDKRSTRLRQRSDEGLAQDASVSRSRPATEGRSLEPRKLRVVVLGHTAQLSGAELALLRVVPALSGVQLHVILAQHGPLVSLLQRAGAIVEVVPMDDRVSNLHKERVRPSTLSLGAYAQSAAYVLRLARRLRQVDPDLVHTNTLKAALYGGTAARLARLPCVWHIRDRIASDYLPYPAVRLIRLAARLLPDAVIVNSRATFKTLPASTRVRTKVVYDAAPDMTTNRVRSTAHDPSKIALARLERAPRSGPSADFRVGMVGRLAPWKGQDVFLRAFAKAFPDGEEIAVGGGCTVRRARLRASAP